MTPYKVTRTTNHPNREICCSLFFHVSMRFQYFEMFRIQYSYASRSISRSLFCSDRFDSYSLCTTLHEGKQSLCMSWLIPTFQPPFLENVEKTDSTIHMAHPKPVVGFNANTIHRYINENAKYPTIIIAMAMAISIVHILTDSLPLALPLLLVEPTRVQCLEPKSSMPNVRRYPVSTTIEIVRNSTWNISW